MKKSQSTGRRNRLLFGLGVIILSAPMAGCAEGPLWRAGKYAPWARNQWAEEEKIAVSLFSRKDELNQMVTSAKNGSVDDMNSAARKLGEVYDTDKVFLIRLHAVKLLGELDSPEAAQVLRRASRDPIADVRIAAVRSWTKMPGETAVIELQEMIGSDTDIDVRLAATRALGNFPGRRTVEALSLALDDTDPALQLRATESLAAATGEAYGRDVQAWQAYVQQQTQPSPNSSLDQTRVAEQKDDSVFR